MTTDTMSAAPPEESQRSSSVFGPAVVAAVSVVVTLCFVKFGLSGDVLVGILFAVPLVVLAAIDLERGLIPNRIVLPATAVVLAANLLVHPSHWFEWIVAAAAALGFFLAVALINPAGLGMGDVKLALLLGAGLGWSVAAALVLGTFAAAIYAVILVLTRPGAGAKTSFALGPFLAGAAIVVLLLQ